MEKIPFNFGKYLSGGYRVVTRDGREPTDLYFKGVLIRAFFGVMEYQWFMNGHYNGLGGESPLDLFLIPISKEGDKEEKGNWISVDDELPEYGKGVLLFISNGMMTIGYLKKATRTSVYRQWQLYGDLDISLCINPGDEATHWHPLPPPPLTSITNDK